MRRFIWHMRGALPTLFLGAMVCAVLAVAGTAAPKPPTAMVMNPEDMGFATKANLMSQLDTVNAATCDPAGLYLFADDAPLMVVWMASEPAELYSATGDFVGPLSTPELTHLIDTTRPFSAACLEPSPVVDTAPQYYL